MVHFTYIASVSRLWFLGADYRGTLRSEETAIGEASDRGGT